MPERLHKIIAAHGIASRREAERMIADGRVTVNGAAAVTGQTADTDSDSIAIDGRLIAGKSRPVYIALNKPRGYVTTVKDECGRKTVMDLLTDLQERVYPIGRLDINSEGLLLMTNDGDFANSVAHPSFEVVKTYEVHIRGDAVRAAEALMQPVEIDSRWVQAVSSELINITDGGGVIRISVIEGRNRQIRRMCAACGVEVRTLKRAAIGSVKLGSLKSGEWRYLTEKEHRSLVYTSSYE